MSGKWAEITAEKFCDSVRDGTHDSPKQFTGKRGFPLVTSKMLKNGTVNLSDAYRISEQDYLKILSRSRVDKWDVLMSMIGTVGECVLVNHDPEYAIKNMALFKFGGDKQRAQWFYYYLTSDLGQGKLRGNFRGSSQQFVSLSQLRNMSLPVPDEKVRNRIVAILSDYDAAIANCRRQIALLEEAAMRLYREWFKDGKGEKMRLGDFVKIKRGKVITKASSKNGQVPVIAAGISPAYFTNVSNVKAPSVTISASGANAGHIWYHSEDIWASDCSYVSGEETPFIHFVYAFLMTNAKAITKMQKGSAQPHVHAKDVEQLQIMLPTEQQIRRYENIVTPSFQYIGKLNEQIRSLTEARDRLLPKLMKGEIAV